MKKFNSFLKIVLGIISLVLAYIQFTNNATKYVVYWVLVALYWFTNYLSGKVH